MKSFLAILCAALCAAVALGLYLYQSGQGKVAALIGAPVLPQGAALFPFYKKEVSRITITRGGESQVYERGLAEWTTELDGQLVRADYAKLDQLLFMLETATVQQEISLDPSSDVEGGLIHLVLRTDSGVVYETELCGVLPRYTGLEPPLAPSFALRYRDGRTYACTSELKAAYPGLSPESLLDHRPFFFHPDLLTGISYQHGGQTVTMARPQADEDWRLTAPLSLRTDADAVQTLVDALYALEASALKVVPRPGVKPSATLTLQSASSALPPQKLSLYKNAAYLEGSPFTYEFADGALDLVVPQVDVLRSKILADFTSGDIHSLLLQSREQSAPVTLAILPTSTGAPRWMYQTLTEWLPATETGVADLLSALTVDAVEGFTLETLPAGQEPDKSITITLRDAPEIHYDLFSTAQHTLIQRRGEDFSAILSSAHARKVQTQPSTWKDNQLWQLSSITLRGLQRQVRGRPLENYSYNFNLELWKGQVGGVPVDEDIDAVSANALLSLLESLRVDRWLPTHEAQRLIGEGSPVASVLTLSQKFTLEGELDGLDTKTLALYPMPGRPQQVICGLQEHATPTQYGLLSKKVALRLIAPLVQE